MVADLGRDAGGCRPGEHRDLWGVRRRASSEGVTSGTEGFGSRFIPPDYRLSARPSPNTPEILMLSIGEVRAPGAELASLI
jgi:hypothetical protein